VTAFFKFIGRYIHQTLDFVGIERQPLARGAGQNQAVDGLGGVMPDEPSDGDLIQLTIPKRGDKRYPYTIECRLRALHV
jgi:hypothetical protein